MKASVIHEFGDTEVLKYEDVPTPGVRPGHVLVKILASGVNRLDHYIREGSVAPELPFPHILGIDASGEIEALGEGVSSFSIGDRVITVPGFPVEKNEYSVRPAATAPSFTLQGLGTPGTYAQYLETPQEWIIRDDTSLTPEETATLPVVLASGVRAVKKVGGVKAGDKVLIHSGASGSGSMQIQVAKALGAQVATTVRSDEKGELAKRVGADLVINTSREDFVEKVLEWTEGRGADVVIDTLGGDVLPKSIDAAKQLGVIVVFGFVAGIESKLDIRNFFFTQKQLKGTLSGDKEDLEWGLERVKEGKIKAVVGKTLPLKDASLAHKLIADNKVGGNVVLLPWAD